MSSGKYYFADYPTSKGYTFLVPIDQVQNPTIVISSGFYDSDIGWDDLLCGPYNPITMPYASWATYSERISTSCFRTDFDHDGDGYNSYTVNGVGTPDAYLRGSIPGIGQPIGP